jgi:hypothetical protein
MTAAAIFLDLIWIGNTLWPRWHVYAGVLGFFIVAALLLSLGPPTDYKDEP